MIFICAKHEWTSNRAPCPDCSAYCTTFPADEWHEDFGPVLWWQFPITEPPYVGSPLDTDWLPDYYTHFSLLPIVYDADGNRRETPAEAIR